MSQFLLAVLFAVLLITVQHADAGSNKKKRNGKKNSGSVQESMSSLSFDFISYPDGNDQVKGTPSPEGKPPKKDKPSPSPVKSKRSPPPVKPAKDDGGPFSEYCRMFSYRRYYRANSYEQFVGLINGAEAGDMVELMPGTHYLSPKAAGARGSSSRSSSKYGYSGNDGVAPTSADGATVWKKNGKSGKPITICGSTDTILDGSDPKRYKGYCLRTAQSSYIRVAGFTVQNCLKGVDIQSTKNSEFMFIKTQNTLAEGMRFRFGSQKNIIQNCTITNTGRLDPGWGEGIYVGTSRKNSINFGLDPDDCGHNIIRYNTFGPGILSENIDAKEYSNGGLVTGNTFNGMDSIGSRIGSAWVIFRANDWIASDNVGVGLLKKGAGFAVANGVKGMGMHNTFSNNQCTEIPEKSFCVFITRNAQDNTIDCNNRLVDSASTQLSNVETGCEPAARGSRQRSFTIPPWTNHHFRFVIDEDLGRPTWM